MSRQLGNFGPGIEEKFVIAGEIKTRYLEAGTGQPVIFLHGGGAGADSWGNWHKVIPPFSQHFRVLAVDMVGFGKTEKPNPQSYTYSQENRVQHILDLMDALGLERVALVGNSMGGATALGVAMQKPESVSKLVLMGSAAAIVKTEMPPDLAPILNYEPSRENMRKILQSLAREVDEEMVEYRYQLTQLPGAMMAYRAMMEHIVNRGGLFYEDDEIRQVKTEVLVVNGREDRISKLDNAFKLVKLLENAWFYVIPQCGHAISLERPDVTTRIISDFLSH